MRKLLITAALALCLTALAPMSASAAQLPVWKLATSSQPTNLVPGSSSGGYLVVATNIGSKVTTGEITITTTLPEDITLNKTNGEPKPFSLSPGAFGPDIFKCATAGQTVTCKGEGTIHPGYWVRVFIPVNVSATPKAIPHVNVSEVSGGGAASAKAETPTTLSTEPPPFDFLAGKAGFAAPLFDEEGTAAKAAGSHPYATLIDLGFPTIAPQGALTGAGHLRSVKIDLPPGVLANPSATPVRCTEAELTGQFPVAGCPNESAVGTVTLKTVLLSEPIAETVPLYNMVPPPGTPAVFGFDALGVGIFPHVIAKLRTDSDYGASGISRDILARGLNPVLDVSTELWGDPAAEEHDFIRGRCAFQATPPCDVPAQPDAFLSLPVACPGSPLTYEAFADSWEEPFPAFPEHEATYESADLKGTSTQVEACNELPEYKPEITARPTTSVSESPSGLEVDLFQPQDMSVDSRSTPALKDARVTLPVGLEVNASQADGLAACSPAQVGMLTAVGESPARFSSEPSSCPNASKVGTVEALSPLLGQYDETGRILQRDPGTGEVIPEPLGGSVFLAQPFANPFNKLLAVYLTVEDPKTGIFAKLAGEVVPDPVTGQLSTVFEENPQLPLEHARVRLFTGPRAPLQTPPTCGPHTTNTQLTPWSAPDTPQAAPGDAFSLAGSPLGGPCPTTASGQPVAATLQGGTLNPQAGKYSPLVLNLSRADGTQRMASLETTFPLGLTGKLADIATCSEAQVAQALSRTQPNEGALEIASPSCPAASQVGIIDAAAGAGPTPFHIGGRLYLSGPYKGAPLSFLAVTPAVAGPFDLGSVAVRIAAYLDPVSAQVKAVSDPFPRILHGIPVDVRSVAVKAERPNFTLNPTSCEPKSFGGSLTSTLGAVAPLSAPFQVGNCSALRYKPKMNVRLFGPIHRGAHPRFRAIFQPRAGDANTARVSFALPRSEFIDQSHFRTICTRVQFAADQCPAGSVYGHVKAISPLVDYPLEGSIYLRSSNNELPDAVALLKGPPSQPVEVELVGRVDSVNGGLRTIFDVVPDAPVTKVIVTLQGAKKGLFQNSTNICKGTHRATVKLTAQNGLKATLRPEMKADCKGAKPGKGGKKSGKGGKGKR